LKFLYLDIKNTYSNDNKYLAVVTENVLWIKDEIDERIYIVNAHIIEDNFLREVSISEFNIDFDLIQIIESSKVDISNLEWIIFKPTISIGNRSLSFEKSMKLNTHFNIKKINSLFRNLSSLNILELIKLNRDYKSLGYSTNEIVLHINKLFSFPLYLSIMAIFASIIMFNIKRNKPKIFHIILGIFLSVLIYYFYYLFNLMGENGKIPLFASVWLPLLIITFFILIGLVRINEK
jgi:lipopolysaccharide export system permease protein